MKTQADLTILVNDSKVIDFGEPKAMEELMLKRADKGDIMHTFPKSVEFEFDFYGKEIVAKLRNGGWIK